MARSPVPTTARSAGMVRILIMTKAPLPGLVKTRLGLEPHRAAELQRASIMDVVAKVRSLGPVTVAGFPEEHLGLIEPLLPPGVRLMAQVGANLGERMYSAAGRLFAEDPGPLLILGTDAPTLPPSRLREATEALDACEVSIVPSRDGGYVLLGLRRLFGEPFSGITWSTEVVFRQTLQRVREAGISVRVLEPWYDVDTPEDLRRLGTELEEDPGLAPHLAEVLGVAITREGGIP